MEESTINDIDVTMGEERNEPEPFYAQISNLILQTGTILFMDDGESKDVKILHLESGRWHYITRRQLQIYVKNLLKNFLNPNEYAELPRDDEDKVWTDSSIKVEGIDVPASLLVQAQKDHFSLSKETKRQMEELFDSKGLYRSEDYFLPPKNILPFKNGFLNLVDGKFRQYGSEGVKGYLYQLNANYRVEYKDEYLPDEFGGLIFNGINAAARYNREINEKRYWSMLECLGYSFLPTNPYRKFFIVIGPTACGKSTLASIMRKVFGDLGCPLQSPSFMRQSRYDHELRADLKGTLDKFWVDISETDGKQVIDAVTIKSYTGNDPLTYRKPHSASRTTKVMNAKIWIVTNTFPKILNYGDKALQDRLVVIDWHNTIPAENRDNDLFENLTTDENRDRIATYFAGIAKRLYHQKTLSVNETFRFNIAKYFYAQGDIVAQFYDWLPKSESDMPANPTNCISTWSLYGHFIQFVKNQIQETDGFFNPMEQRAFENRFAEIANSDHFHFVKRERNSKCHFYRGISIPPNIQLACWQEISNQTGYGPALHPPAHRSHSPQNWSPLPSPSSEPVDNEPIDTFHSTQPGDGSASRPKRYIPS